MWHVRHPANTIQHEQPQTAQPPKNVPRNRTWVLQPVLHCLGLIGCGRLAWCAWTCNSSRTPGATPAASKRLHRACFRQTRRDAAPCYHSITIVSMLLMWMLVVQMRALQLPAQCCQSVNHEQYNDLAGKDRTTDLDRERQA